MIIPSGVYSITNYIKSNYIYNLTSRRSIVSIGCLLTHMKPDRIECLKKDILHHIRLEPQLYMCWDIQSVEYFKKSVNFTRGFMACNYIVYKESEYELKNGGNKTVVHNINVVSNDINRIPDSFLRGEMTPVHPCNWMNFGNMRIKSLWLER